MMQAQKKNPLKKLAIELSKWDTLRHQLEEVDIDVEYLIDTLDGETELFEIVLFMAEEISERDAMQDAIKSRIKVLSERNSRIENGTETLKAVITQAMDRASVTKIPGDFCTVSTRIVKPKLNVTNEAALPSKYFKVPSPVLNKKLLGEDLANLTNGKTIEGAVLGNGGISLTIRRR